MFEPIRGRRWITAGCMSLAALAITLSGCAKTRDGLPGDVDPRQPWAVTSAPKLPAADPAGVDAELFSVEDVMRHQHAIGIDDAQKQAVLEGLGKVQAEFNRLEWELNGEREKLVESLKSERVDEAAALARAGRVTALEGRLKLAHLRLLVQVKNVLTSGQQKQLAELRQVRAERR